MSLAFYEYLLLQMPFAVETVHDEELSWLPQRYIRLSSRDGNGIDIIDFIRDQKSKGLRYETYCFKASALCEGCFSGSILPFYCLDACEL